MSSANEILQELETRDVLFKYSLQTFEHLGLSPVRNPAFTPLRRLFYGFTFFGTFILLFLSIVEQKGNVKKISLDVYAPTQQISCKFIYALYLRKDILNLLKKINACWPDNIFGVELETKIAESKSQFRNIYLRYRILIWSTVVIYCIKPLLNLYSEQLFVWYYPFNADNRYLLITNILLQQYYIVVLAHLLLACDALFFSLMSHCFTQLEAIKYGFQNLDFEEDEHVVAQKFARIVKHHNFVLGSFSIINDINNIYSIQFLNQFLTVIICICCGIFLLNIDGFPPSLENVLTFIPYLGCYHFQLYIYCATGDEVAQQVEGVSLAIYESKWHQKHNPELRKGLQMVINIAKIPNKLSIGGFWLLNLRTFMLVIKTSVSFNTFMQTIYKK